MWQRALDVAHPPSRQTALQAWPDKQYRMSHPYWSTRHSSQRENLKCFNASERGGCLIAKIKSAAFELVVPEEREIQIAPAQAARSEWIFCERTRHVKSALVILATTILVSCPASPAPFPLYARVTTSYGIIPNKLTWISDSCRCLRSICAFFWPLYLCG